MKKEEKCTPDGCRRNLVGGQAVLEGVMMKADNHVVTTCRKEDGTLTVYDDTFVSVRQRNRFLDLPLVRGVVNFVEMMKLSVKTLGDAADALGIEEEEESKFEKWMKKHLGLGLTDMIMIVGVVLGLALALFLFLFLPTLFADLIDRATGGGLGIWRAVIEGSVKILIFLGYMIGVSFVPDIRRTFMYHGAEHKSIACFEAGDELTPENASRHTRFHPRCGTSFMFFMILIGIVVGLFVRWIIPGLPTLGYVGIRLLLFPLVVGLGYEIIRLAGKHDNILTRVLSAPGLWVQRITTREPTLPMLEVAITSLKCALRNQYPEFAAFYYRREWEPEKPHTPTPAETRYAAVRERAAQTDPLPQGELAAADDAAQAVARAALALRESALSAKVATSVLRDTVEEERVSRMESGAPMRGGERVIDALVTRSTVSAELRELDRAIQKLDSEDPTDSVRAEQKKCADKKEALLLERKTALERISSAQEDTPTDGERDERALRLYLSAREADEKERECRRSLEEALSRLTEKTDALEAALAPVPAEDRNASVTGNADPVSVADPATVAGTDAVPRAEYASLSDMAKDACSAPAREDTDISPEEQERSDADSTPERERAAAGADGERP